MNQRKVFLHVKMSDDQGRFFEINELFTLSSLHRVWRVDRQPAHSADETPGTGETITKAVIDWLFKNHGPELMPVTSVPAKIIESIIIQAPRSLLYDLGQTIIEKLNSLVKRMDRGQI